MDLIMRNTIVTPILNELEENKEMALDFDGADERIVVLVKNDTTSAATLTVKAGNGLQGVNDLVLTVPKSAVSLVKLDSGRFKNVSGTNKGKIVVVSATALEVATVAMV